MQVLAHLNFVFQFFAVLFAFGFFTDCASAQTVVNGQIFTNALAIIDGPAPQTQVHAGSNINIAIDVSGLPADSWLTGCYPSFWKQPSGYESCSLISGDGKLQSSAAIPGSNLPTRFDGLEIFLVSSQTNVNITVSTGPGLLTQESGSTVKHLNWPIPTCISPGQYNLTFYESSHISNQAFFTITPIPLQVGNSSPAGQCQTNVNTLQAQPQASSPPASSPFLPNGGSQQSVIYTATAASPAATPASLGMVTSATGVEYSAGPGPMTITVSAGGNGFPFPSTVTVNTASPNTVTLVLVTMETLTTTESGETRGTTATIASTTTMTAIMTTADGSTAGFVPVNAGVHFTGLSAFSLSWVLGSWIALFLLWCV